MFDTNKIHSYFTNVFLIDHLSYKGKQVFSVQDMNSNESGILTFYSESRQWDIYVDNYPSPKKYYSTNLPVKCINDFVTDINRAGLSLVLNQEFNYPHYLKGIDKEFDCENNEIVFVVDSEDRTKFIKTIFRKSNSPHVFDQDTELSNASHLLNFMWKEKYGQEIPINFDTYNATTTKALAFGYDGNADLSDSEIEKINQIASTFDLTYDIIWFVIESLGWRPNKPEPENSFGWKLIERRYSNDDPMGTIRLVQYLLTQDVAIAA